MANRSTGRRNPAKKLGTGVTSVRSKQKKHLSIQSKKVQIPANSKPFIPQNLRRIKSDDDRLITYVLDTNVIRDHPEAIFKFQEHDVVIISPTWREADHQKKGFSTGAMNLRHLTVTVDRLTAGKSQEELMAGIPLIPPGEKANKNATYGKLIIDFSRPKIPAGIDMDLSYDEPDDPILMICLAYKAKGRRVVLVTKDGNFRVRATWAGIEAESYLNEAIVDIIGEEHINTGYHNMPEDIFEKQGKKLKLENLKGGMARYALSGPEFKNVYSNDFLLFKNDMKLIVVDKPSAQKVVAETFFINQHGKPWDVEPKSTEQELALQLLLDERIPGLALAGKAGSGKTYLALAAALHQTINLRLFSRIIVTRSPIGADEDIGFLPGTEREKMDPWMGSIYDNLEMLSRLKNVRYDDPVNRRKVESAGKDAGLQQILQWIDFKSLNFMQGRNIPDSFIIVDEAQNLRPPTLKMINTRVGMGSKIVLLGNVNQINEDSLTEHTNGISRYIRLMADSKLSGHITLRRGERSPYATETEERL